MIRSRTDAQRYIARIRRDADALWESARHDAATGALYREDEVVPIGEMRAHVKQVAALLERPKAA